MIDEEIEEQPNIKYEDTPILTTYINQIKKHAILTREEEYAIIFDALAGNQIARQKIINSNLLIVVKIAHEYKNIFYNIMDLIQEGNYGIVKALSKFDPSRGYRFITYATWWARSMMLRYIFNNSHMIKPGTTNEQKKLFYNLRKEQKRLEILGMDADAATIAQNLDVSEKDVIEMDGRLRNDVYIDAPLADNDDELVRTQFDYMASPIEQQPDNAIENSDFRKMLCGKLDTFAKKLKNEKQKAIFYRRIFSDEPETLQSIADTYGITKERVRQIEEEMLVRLKKYLKNVVKA